MTSRRDVGADRSMHIIYFLTGQCNSISSATTHLMNDWRPDCCYCDEDYTCEYCVLTQPEDYPYIEKRAALHFILTEMARRFNPRLPGDPDTVRAAKRARTFIETPSLDDVINGELSRIESETAPLKVALKLGPVGVLEEIEKKHVNLVHNYGEVIAAIFTKEACARAINAYAPHKKNEMELFFR